MSCDPSTRTATANAAGRARAEPRNRNAVASISLPDLARLVGTVPPESPDLARVWFALRRCKTGQPLVRNGDPFRSVYAVRCGVFKQVAVTPTGAEQVLAFPMAGDVIGA
ncbi:MAG TPA: cyclic nucleotide-binding domain-containing protein [Gemmatimonadaceae bacterium]